ncbi:MAG: hypothetical protein WBW73_27300 [Rhodoplanes sp.]
MCLRIWRAICKDGARLQPAQLGLKNAFIVMAGNRKTLVCDIQRRPWLSSEQQRWAQKHKQRRYAELIACLAILAKGAGHIVKRACRQVSHG